MISELKSGALEIPSGWSSKLLGNEYLTHFKIYYRENKSILTEFSPRQPVEGPSAHAHGGFLATILDETMGSTCWYNGLPVLAANLQVKYRKSVPLNGTYYAEAQLERLESRRAVVKARLFDEKNLYCESTGLFIRVPMQLLEKQSDMKLLVEIIQTLNSGRSLTELIAMDKRRQSPIPADIRLLLERAGQLGQDILDMILNRFK